MPHRLNEFRAKIQFVTASRHPHLIYKACLATNVISNSRYIQVAVCEALSRDLGIPLQELLDELPEPRGWSATRIGSYGTPRPGPSPTVESVK